MPAILYALFAWLLWLGMENHGSAERGAKRVLKQVAALGAAVVVAMLAFAAADRAELLSTRHDGREDQVRAARALAASAAADVPRMGRRARLRDVAAPLTVKRDQ